MAVKVSQRFMFQTSAVKIVMHFFDEWEMFLPAHMITLETGIVAGI